MRRKGTPTNRLEAILESPQHHSYGEKLLESEDDCWDFYFRESVEGILIGFTQPPSQSQLAHRSPARSILQAPIADHQEDSCLLSSCLLSSLFAERNAGY